MARLQWIRLIISVVSGIAIGIVVTALINLFSPIPNLWWTVAAVCIASAASSFVGYLLGAGRKKEGA